MFLSTFVHSLPPLFAPHVLPQTFCSLLFTFRSHTNRKSSPFCLDDLFIFLRYLKLKGSVQHFEHTVFYSIQEWDRQVDLDLMFALALILAHLSMKYMFIVVWRHSSCPCCSQRASLHGGQLRNASARKSQCLSKLLDCIFPILCSILPLLFTRKKPHFMFHWESKQAKEPTYCLFISSITKGTGS